MKSNDKNLIKIMKRIMNRRVAKKQQHILSFQEFIVQVCAKTDKSVEEITSLIQSIDKDLNFKQVKQAIDMFYQEFSHLQTQHLEMWQKLALGMLLLTIEEDTDNE